MVRLKLDINVPYYDSIYSLQTGRVSYLQMVSIRASSVTYIRTCRDRDTCVMVGNVYFSSGAVAIASRRYVIC